MTRMAPDESPTIAASIPPVDTVIDGSKLMRLEGAVAAVLDELHHVEVRTWDEERIDQLVARILAEIGSCLPDPLLDELVRLIGPLRDGVRSPSTVRVVLAQLEGWLSAVVAEAMSAVVMGQVVRSTTPGPPAPTG